MTHKTAFFYEERTMWHNPEQTALIMPVGEWVQPVSGHGFVEHAETKRRVRNLMEVSGLLERLLTPKSSQVEDVDLLRVHPQSYLDRFQKISATGGGFLSETCPIGPRTYEIACLSAGIAKSAVEAILNGSADKAYALCRPPGHHCLPDEGMGACYLANVAIAIESAKANLGLGKVAVVDWDVHHGNGTQSIFYDRSDVLTISIHQESCFPPGPSGGSEDRGTASGEGYNINIPLLTGGGHVAYMEAMQRIVVPALERFKPELIIVASGLDANNFDPLARMMLHSESYRAMTKTMVEVADKLCDGKLCMVHEGGYSESYVPFCTHAIIEELSGVKTEVVDPLLEFIEAQQPREAHQKLQIDLLEKLAVEFGLV